MESEALDVIPMSTVTEEGVIRVRNEVCDSFGVIPITKTGRDKRDRESTLFAFNFTLFNNTNT